MYVGAALYALSVILAVRSCDASTGEELCPVYEVVRGVDVVSQIPKNPNSLLLLLHGFNSNSLIFWDPHPNCSKCTGLPEDRALTLAALNRGYAVIAISSVTNWVQWPPEGNVDVANVVAILRDWRSRNGLLELPLTALGTSHGGRFLSTLATVVDFFAIVMMVSYANEDAIGRAYARGTYPPTLFVHMPKDALTEAFAQANMARLAERNIPVGSVICNPIPVHDTYLTQRIPGMTLELSATTVLALSKHGYLDSQSYLTYNYTVPQGWVGWYDPVDWSLVLDELQVFPLPENTSPYWQDGMIQELRLADAFHSTTSLPSSDIFDWLDGNFRFSDPGSLSKVAAAEVS